MAIEQLVDRLYDALVGEIRDRRPQYLREPFTVAEIYQDLIPYRTHRDRIGVDINGDYEHALLRLLAGEGDMLMLDSEPARKRMREELASTNPNTGLFREYAALDVRLNASLLPDPGTGPEKVGVVGGSAPGEDAATEAERDGFTDESDASSDPPVPSVEQPVVDPPAVTATEATGDESSEPVKDDALPTDATETVENTPEDGKTTNMRPRLVDLRSPGPCRWCREELPRRDKLRYCPFCGTDVNLVPCPSCGEELEPDWRFCIACAAEVSPDS